MLETLLAGPEYVAAAKRANVYSGLLTWIAAQRRGTYCAWPVPGGGGTEGGFKAPSAPAAPMATALATIPPPKRALDVLHESYRILSIDDSKPLTHEMLRQAYKKAAVRAHPDKGGNPEAFDAVTRAFLYLEEVLNKLIPKTASDGGDARFTAPVNPETAMRARGGATTVVPAAPAGTLQLEGPPIALNPKKLDMAVFNKLFEENRLPDPDADDGYGDWIKTHDTRGTSNTIARGNYNKDVFNKMFETEAKRQTASTELAQYAPPSEIILAPEFGTELGGGRPAQYTKPVSANGIAYTDLKYAYGEGSTFSQNVANVSLDGRPKNIEEAKREYGSAPRALTTEEAAAVAAFEQAKAAAERQRQQRMAARDVDAESMHARMRSRLMIQ